MTRYPALEIFTSENLENYDSWSTSVDLFMFVTSATGLKQGRVCDEARGIISQV